MSIRWDPLLASATSRELGAALAGASATALAMDEASRRVLLYTDRATLALELHPREGWVSLLEPADPPPDARPLRARVEGVRALSDESAFAVDLPRAKRQSEDLELIVELVGNRWNAVLVEAESRAIREVLAARGGKRPLESGALYFPPPSTSRATPADADEWKRIVGGAEAEGWEGPEGGRGAGPGGSEVPIRDRILRRIAGASSVNVASLTGTDGFDRWKTMTDPSRWAAFVMEATEGPQPYPVLLPGRTGEAHPSLLAALLAVRTRSPDAVPARALLLPAALLERARERARGARKKVAALGRQLDSGADPAALRSVGDLILARFSSIPRGKVRVTLEGFDGEPLEVELDPGLTPQKNADRYYADAARAEKARRELPKRIAAAEREAARWGRLLEGAARGEVSPDELSRSLGGDGQLGDRPSGGEGTGTNRRAGPPRALPYLRFTSSGGHEIRVGRSAAKNDELTLRHSSPDDIWLHARQSAGAHVVLRWGRKENPPQRDLVEAAILAALNSDGRHAGTVAVDWTRRKFVRKPRKAAPGTVTVERAETIFVAPDPALAERLAVKN